MFIAFLIEPSGFVILIGAYLLPILLLYGLPSSILSDFVTKKLKGVVRGGVALVIHLTLATVFVMIIGKTWVPMSFVLVVAIVSSLFFWSVDELLKLHQSKQNRIPLVQ